MVYDHLPHDKYEKYENMWYLGGVYPFWHNPLYLPQCKGVERASRGCGRPETTDAEPAWGERDVDRKIRPRLTGFLHTPKILTGKDLVENKSKIPKVAQFLLFPNLCGYHFIHFPQTTRLGAPTIPTLGAPSRFLWRTGCGPPEQHMITDLPRREDRKPILCWVPKKSPPCRRLSSSIRFYMFSVVLLSFNVLRTS